MATEGVAIKGEFGKNAAKLWQGEPSACQILREHLRRLRTLERAGVELRIRFAKLPDESRRKLAQDLYGIAEECGDEDIFRKGYQLFLNICQKPTEFPSTMWTSLREEVRACRSRFAARMAMLTNISVGMEQQAS